MLELPIEAKHEAKRSAKRKRSAVLPNKAAERHSEVSFSQPTKIQVITHSLETGQLEKDEKVMINTCFRLINYVKTKEGRTLDSVKNLISHMERSLLSLHRKKKKLVEKRYNKGV